MATTSGWVDSHCHVHSAEDVDAQIMRAQDAGVAWMVSVGTDLPTSHQAMDLAARASERPCHRRFAPARRLEARRGMGHAGGARARPRSAWASAKPGSTSTTSTRRATSRRWRSDSRSGSPTRLGKALVIHSRDAWDDTFRVLEAEGVPERTVFHCFTGGPAEARARPRSRLLALVQRDRLVQERGRPARRGADRARRPAAGRDRRAVPRARAVPRQAERARVRHGRRRRARRGPQRDRRGEIAALTHANAVTVFGT